MPTMEENVAALTTATTTLTTEVQTKKAVLDQKVAEATTQANLATTNGAAQVVLAAGQVAIATAKAGEAAVSEAAASGHKNSALAIFGSAAALSAAMAIMSGQVGTAEAQARLAQLAAASAASVAQQDLSGVTAQALHRSPNPVVAQFLYDTSKDSDGGAWIERLAAQSFMTEPLNGVYLTNGAYNGYQSELAARAQGATLGAELNPSANGDFATGWTPHANASISGGKLTINTTITSGSIATTTVPAVANTLYLVSWTVEACPVGSGGLSPGLGGGNTTASGNSVGTFVDVIVASTTGALVISVRGADARAGTILSKVSIKPITAFADPTGRFYQLAPDGRHYRTWRNLVAGSSTFASGWTLNDSTPTDNAVTSPSGESLSLITEGTLSSANSSQTVFSSAAGLTMTYSIELQRGNHDWVRLQIHDTGATHYYRLFVNVATGALGTATTAGASAPTVVTPATIQSLGSGVYRVTFTLRSNTATAQWFMASAAADASTARVNNGTRYQGAVHAEIAPSFTGIERKAAGVGSQSEVFRGNTARFPRLAGIVAEASRVVIYALDQPGRPMWMVFVNGSLGNVWSTSNLLMYGGSSPNVTSVAMLNGVLSIGGSHQDAGLVLVDFIKDQAVKRLNNGNYGGHYKGNIAQRNSGAGYNNNQPTGVSTLAGPGVNSVAMMVRPTAPIDPVTQLPVPTIGVAVGTGNAGNVGTVLMDDGTAVNYTQASNDGVSVAFNKRGDVIWGLTNSSSIFALPLQTAATVLGNITSAGIGGRIYTTTSTLALPAGSKRITSAGNVTASHWVANEVLALRENPMNSGAGLGFRITGTHNTGAMTGDIRRCWLADVSAGTVSGVEIVTNGDFSGGTTGWDAANANSTLSIEGGRLRITATAAGTAGARQLGGPFTDANTGRYTGSVEVTNPLGRSWAAYARGAIWQSASSTSLTSTGSVTAANTATEVCSLLFTATAPGDYIEIDNFSTKASVGDRSVKNKDLQVYGTLAKTAVTAGAQAVFYSGWSASNYLQEAYSADLDSISTVSFWGTIPVNVAAAGWAFDRSAAAGAFCRIGHTATGQITASFSDGTTTRTVTTTQTYATGLPIKGRANYTLDGTLTISVEGEVVARATGTPLGSLANASAVATVGIHRDLTAPWAGGLGWVKVGATVPSTDAMRWMYALERMMFQPGAQITLPDTGNVVDMGYDAVTDQIRVATAANECRFHGFVRVASNPSAVGSISKISGGAGIKLVARTTTNPGVDISVPSQNLKEELLRRGEEARAQARLTSMFDFVGGFTGSITNGSTSVTGVANLTLPAGATLVGARVSGTGIPAGATVQSHVGTTITLSAPATATTAGLQINLLDFIGPPGFELHAARTDGTARREGATQAWQRMFDGFREYPYFPAAPGNTAWVQLEMRRAA
jgi:trimeric autotransporter adhesin